MSFVQFTGLGNEALIMRSIPKTEYKFGSFQLVWVKYTAAAAAAAAADDDDDDGDDAGERRSGAAARHLPVSDDLQQEPPGHTGRRQTWQTVRRRRRRLGEGDRPRPGLHTKVLRVLRKADCVPKAFRQSVVDAVQLRNSRGTSIQSHHYGEFVLQ